MRIQRSIVLVMALLAMGPTRGWAAEAISPADNQVINTLLDRLKERKDLHFVREGKVYDAKTATWYLRFKWDHNQDKVHSVEDFITLASVGGEHGEVTYYVQFDDGKRQPAREVLEASLKVIRSEGK